MIAEAVQEKNQSQEMTMEKSDPGVLFFFFFFFSESGHSWGQNYPQELSVLWYNKFLLYSN